ncbi:hypothetical protein EZV62_026417 [Acer yangbiense]|uniref:Cysteine-rich receptor-like protein kinase 25 n=1 Tax=Acer yangbiense TaxID=1000413 RepID=A0A5C7GRA0_9ROSI|nr:hypothetical protein EZV62_026417 [Acer yangbiense]
MIIFSSFTNANRLELDCPDSSVYTPNSPFEQNLKLLLQSLSSNTSLNGGFYNSSIGDDTNQVYGQALCRGDANHTACQDCIENAVQDILKNCISEDATIWYDLCQIHYSSQYFFSINTGYYGKFPDSNDQRRRISDPVLLTKVLKYLMDNITSEASSDPLKFAAGEINFIKSNNIYGLAQCTRDISARYCDSCLSSASVELIDKYGDLEGGIVVDSNCNVRFELQRFYNGSSISLTYPTSADPTYLYHFCSSTNFTRNSTYQTNLNRLLLLSSLPSNGSSDGFRNTTFGQVPNRVYGLFLCRGDVTAATCQNCVTFATGDAPQRCPVSKGITIWYDECLLRYSDSNFFSTSTETPTVALLNTNNVSDPTRFDQIMGGLMNLAATQAADSPKRFATRKGNFTVFQDIYCLVQCTPDLSSSDCNRCLRISIANLPTGKPGARTLYPSCYSRYEMYPFYNENLTETPAPAPTPVLRSPPSPGSLTRPKGNNNSLLIIAIVVPIVVSVLLFVLGYCFLAWRARGRKKFNAIPEEIEKKRISSSIIISIVLPITVAVVLFIIIDCCFLTRRKRKKFNSIHAEIAVNEITTVESLQFGFGTIQAATNGFSTNNKLSEGGFGEVYKGVLPNGQDIAVKMLPRSSGQGAEEFKNKVELVAKIQHRNLVRLLGFCLEGQEKILVYEFVPNISLDQFLYGMNHLNKFQ